MGEWVGEWVGMHEGGGGVGADTTDGRVCYVTVLVHVYVCVCVCA